MTWNVFHRSDTQDAVLERVLGAAAAAAPSQVVAFDLDGCLFDNRPRQVQVAQTWASRQGDPRLEALRVEHFQDFVFTNTLARLGLSPDEAAALAAAFHPFWERWFFADDYVIHDRPLPGAARFVRAVQAAGVTVVYLTGRTHTQRPTTLRNLAHFGFPIDADGSRLWTKPTAEESDAAWKRFALDSIIEEGGRLVAFLDNEPGHVVHALDAHPDATIVWLDTDHSPRAIAVPDGTPTLRGWLRTTDWAPPA